MLGTLRMIVVSNGRKLMAAILQGIISLIWIFVISIIVVDIKNNMLKIVFFVIGSIIGSYLGSILEESLALGTNMLLVISNNNLLVNNIRNKGYAVTLIKGSGINGEKNILFIIVKRKDSLKLKNIIKKYDQNSLIIFDSINI